MLREVDTRDDHKVRQNKTYICGVSQPLLGMPFYYSIRKVVQGGTGDLLCFLSLLYLENFNFPLSDWTLAPFLALSGRNRNLTYPSTKFCFPPSRSLKSKPSLPLSVSLYHCTKLPVLQQQNLRSLPLVSPAFVTHVPCS